MADHPTLQGHPREVVGKRVSQLRRSGLVPGVISGPVLSEPKSVSVDAREFESVYRAVGTTGLVDLALGGGTTQPVFIREVQRHPVKGSVLNVEFYAPNLSRPVVAEVPLVLVGEPSTPVDGVVTHSRQTLQVRALPDDVPHQVEVDLSLLGGDRTMIQVQDLTLPPGVEVLTPADDVVANVEAAAPAEEILEPSAEQRLAEEVGDQPAAASEGAQPVEER